MNQHKDIYVYLSNCKLAQCFYREKIISNTVHHLTDDLITLAFGLWDSWNFFSFFTFESLFSVVMDFYSILFYYFYC